MKRFTGKVALITGGTYGIGFAIAKRLAAEGARVMICSRKEENIQAALDKFKKWNLDVHGIPCHVGNASDRTRLIEETIEKFGQIDILVPNVAVNPKEGLVPGLECPASIFDKTLDVNLKATYVLAQEALPHLRKQAPGSNIVFISSFAGYDPPVVAAPYSVGKTALFGLTKAIGVSLAREGIRVNCVAPGIVHTPFIEGLYEQYEPIYLPKVPMGRFGQPDEIAGVVAFLASNDASYVTCETIAAAGGMLSRL